MKRSYIDYAMSVIVGRALPDVRDGLKPAHRRVLFAMHDDGPGPNRAAQEVREDRRRRHGQLSTRTATARSTTRSCGMAQDFNMRYPLVDGQGNFGSVDGDPPAAMRYTEARLTRAGRRAHGRHRQGYRRLRSELRRDQGRAHRPSGAVPEPAGQRLGRDRRRHGDEHPAAQPRRDHRRRSSRSSTIPELRDARCGSCSRSCTAPISPPAAIIVGRAGIRQAYHDRPRHAHRCARKATIETLKNGRQESIVVTEIPYQVNKAKLIEKIADLVRDKKIEGISDLRDESDREGMRIVIELKRDDNAGRRPEQPVQAHAAADRRSA